MDAHKCLWTGDGTCPNNLPVLVTSIFSHSGSHSGHSGFREKETQKGKSFLALTR